MNGNVYGPHAPGVTPGLLDRLLHALLPAPCLACGTPLPARAQLGLCARCRGRLRPLYAGGASSAAGAVCPGCARPLAGIRPAGGIGSVAGAASRCGRCLGAPPAYDRLFALFLYQPPLDAVLRGLKFGRLDYLGAQIAALAAELAELPTVDLVVPIPLHWRRRLARGYNQSERIARPLARHLGIPYTDALSRRRATPPQTGLGRRDRLANLHRAFRLRRPQTVAGRRILLVDDVATTGATLEAAARELRRAGALEILALVAGRTP